MAAVKLCVDRIFPRVVNRVPGFELPPLIRAADAPPAIAAIAQALADGDLSAAEAADLGKFVGTYVRAVKQVDFEKRLAGVEMRLSNPKPRPPAVSLPPWSPPPVTAEPPPVDSTLAESHIGTTPQSVTVVSNSPE